MWKDGKKILGFKKEGRKNFALLEGGELIASGMLKNIEIECSDCQSLKQIGYRAALLLKLYVCQSCGKKGSKNPFYGKTHSEETKSNQSSFMKGRSIGELNPFYGKSHTKESKMKISESLTGLMTGALNGFYGKTHSAETIATIMRKNKIYNSNRSVDEKQLVSEKLSKAQHRLNKENPKKYRKDKQKAAYASSMIQGKYKKNKLEQLFHDHMIQQNIEVEYSFIRNRMQFDFGHKKSKTLIELNGDYWHGNPLKYGEDEGLKPLNEMQRMAKIRDKAKRSWAQEHGYNLLVIWEHDMYNNINEVIKRVKNAIKI